MTSHDVRDMLDLPQEGTPRPTKKQKLNGPRPVLKGLAREVQNLGGDNPIAIVPEVTVFKKRRFATRKPAAKWDARPFKNSARQDGLILRHWRRKDDKPAAPTVDGEGEEKKVEEIEDSTFAKYNVQVNIPDYTDEEYNLRLQNQEWTKHETDYLFSLCREYDLRFPVIWDRYEYEPPIPQPSEGDAAENAGALIVPPKTRTVEDMKARYYSVAATVMALRKPPIKMNSAEFNLHEVMLNFNPAQETARKKFAETAFHRTKDEAAEEQSLLLELKRIMARADKLGEERRELYARLEAPPSNGNIAPYTTSQGLAQLVSQLASADRSKKHRKSLMGGETMSPATGPNTSTQQPYDRRESSVRESISGPSGLNNKKGSSQNPTERRQLTEEEERIYGVSRHDRIGTSGPAFRQEKILKPLQSKSAVQQQKITNVLNELGIPYSASTRLIMPTAEVGEGFDALLHNKLQGEIATAKAVRAERERVERERGEGGAEVKREEGVGIAESRKRSASVMSAASDRSGKRLKK
ncbi:putative SWR1-complex protein 4 [Glarea lozoyensis 74030]|uniref:SWR1-complex protein 4 n=1 Tax=Glarea lozoyensis (strain ATCC 74030 / MF5533) TaxID=1104152 RepID=H0ENC2_GLAL7|nr:putative SWR1-complex protein 4 [Glarea lozoyensis 74030]